MKNRLFEPLSAAHTTKKNDYYLHDLKQLLGKKIELSLRNQEPIMGILDICNDSSVELLICGHSFMINRDDILSVRSI
jgi:hypothetical protein